jgi:transcriptional regulator with XRE-family HTH domain
MHAQRERNTSLDLSGRLGRLLLDVDMTRSQLAALLHVDRSIVDLWCNGGRAVPRARLALLAKALQVSYEELTGDAEPPPPKRTVLVPPPDYMPPEFRPAPSRPAVHVYGPRFEAGALGGTSLGYPSPVPGRPRRS